MSNTMQKERWATRLGLVLAMAGNAVGLGNFLRFPAQAAKNGGGAFLIPYIVALLLMGIPLMWVEWTMGRYGGQQGHHSAPGIFHSMGRRWYWKYFGAVSLLICLVIVSYYLYIESWCFAYTVYSFLGGFQIEAPGQFFDRLTGSEPNSIWAISGWGLAIFLGCITLNVYLLSRGLVKGIEQVAKIIMPLLIVFAIILAIRGLMVDPEAGDLKAKTSALTGLNFIWNPKFTDLGNPTVWLAAVGQVFFTLSIGMGSIHCYASYLRSKDDVALTGMTTAWTNEFCEVVLGGTILIPIAVAYLSLAYVENYVQQNSGFELGFMVFPTLFNNWGAFAPFAGFLWFGLLFFAAITSSLAMGQPVMAFFQNEFGMSRQRSAIVLGVLILSLALPVALFHGSTFTSDFDFWASTFLLVVFALVETILFAWVFGMTRGWDELNRGAELKVPRFFFFVIKYVTPIFILVILIAFAFKPRGTVEVHVETGQTQSAAYLAMQSGSVPVVSPGGSLTSMAQILTAYHVSELDDWNRKKEDKAWGAYFEAPFTGVWPEKWEWAGSGLIGKILHEDLPSEKAAEELKLQQEITDLRDKKAANSIEQKAIDRNIDDLESQIQSQDFAAGQKRIRNIARIVMIATFALFALLVFLAWRKREAEGSTA